VSEAHAFLAQLESIIDQRLRELPEGSYVARLHSSGSRKIAQKVGEEGVELALAVATGDREEALAEAADLLFHTLLALRTLDLTLEDVCGELASRHRAD
jgi:phosphoribosyl-ATP pyrophosphohydrolase/phosphoribosyl-AMP cyclohydrolase